MPLFDIPQQRSTRTRDKQVANKTKKKASTTIKGGGGVLGKINEIKAIVETRLGKYRDESIVISDIDSLHEYINACIKNKYISIDTETTGLDPLQDKLVGICIYTRQEKPAYIPVNHVSYITGMPTSGQIPINEIRQEFARLLAENPHIDMFNASFDIRVLRANGIDAYCTYDAYLAARLMNENEIANGLKQLHKKYILDGKEDAFSFDSLFRGITFDKVPIQTAYLYAAHDAIITAELADYQRKYLYFDSSETMDSRNGMNGVAWVFYNIEMPCIEPVVQMEDNGIEFDFDKQEKLSVKYNKMLEDKKQLFYHACDEYSDQINNYKHAHKDCKLDSPINIASPTQLAILLYDILQVDAVDKKKPRGTGEEILEKINLPITKTILEYRTLSKLVDTYIDKLPDCVNSNDGRIHCKFNQYGARTGRMSSSDPNLQNIPSHNKEIRQMFKASDGYVLMSSDFSQQEPKCLAALCRKAGDSQMYDTFMNGKDLYSEIASKAFNKSYEECLEFNDDGTTNKEGKERRTQAKSILLGVLYGRGEASVAEQLNVSVEKAKAIKESVFIGFPAIRQFENASLDMAYDLGYVTTVCGRKRRLPDLQLPEFEIEWENGSPPDDDLLDFDNPMPQPEGVPERKVAYYTEALHNAWGKDKARIMQQAREEGIRIKDNGAKIADAERQCVNSRIQGSAADLTKLAMIKLSNNKELRDLGFRLLIPVHDEIIAECPRENARECSDLLAQIMSQAAEDILEMPVNCDVAITDCWYGEAVNL